MSMFQGIGILLGLYVIYAIIEGKVEAKDGIHMTTVRRSEKPGYYWIVIVVYTALAIACYFFF